MKTKRLPLVTIFLLLLLFAVNVFPSDIILKHGSNIITIKIFNNSKMDIKSIRILPEINKLTEGISITKNSKQKLDVPAEKKSDLGIELNIAVEKNVKAGTYEIPLILQDKNKQAWNYKLQALVVDEVVKEYGIQQNYPNPFNPQTRIDYNLANEKEQETKLTVYNISGQKIRTLVNARQSSGTYSVIWDGKDDNGNTVTSGVYIYRISSGLFQEAKKMLYIK